jgi:hypothetical protein
MWIINEWQFKVVVPGYNLKLFFSVGGTLSGRRSGLDNFSDYFIIPQFSDAWYIYAHCNPVIAFSNQHLRVSLRKQHWNMNPLVYSNKFYFCKRAAGLWALRWLQCLRFTNRQKWLELLMIFLSLFTCYSVSASSNFRTSIFSQNRIIKQQPRPHYSDSTVHGCE